MKNKPDDIWPRYCGEGFVREGSAVYIGTARPLAKDFVLPGEKKNNTQTAENVFPFKRYESA